MDTIRSARVSVIIPVHNRREKVREAIASVYAQSWPAWELVVVDDGSDDGTGQELERLNSRTPPFTIVSLDSTHGVSFARNCGVRHSTAPLIAFLDSDDIWHPAKLAHQVEWFACHPDGVAVQTGERWIRNGRFVNPPATHRKRAGDLFESSLARCMITPSSVMMRRTLFDELGGFNESLPACEDYELWLRLTSRYPVGLVDTVLLTRYGGHADQLSSRYPRMDRFRIRALLALISSNTLTARQLEQARAMLSFRAGVVANGFLKRGNRKEYEHYIAFAST